MEKCKDKRHLIQSLWNVKLFKNRLLHLYKILEKKAEDPKVNGNECAKCCEVASNIAIDVLKMESEGIKAVKDALIAEKEATRRSSLAISSRQWRQSIDVCMIRKKLLMGIFSSF